MNKAKRLALAAVVAPEFRSQTQDKKLRRVAKVDANGNVIGYSTLAEIQESLLRRTEIEISVQEGVRPRETLCKTCGRVFGVGGKGVVPEQCPRCKKGKCVRCGVALPHSGGSYGKPRECKPCYEANRPRVPDAKCACGGRT